MTDGHWTITQYAPNTKNGITVTEITIADHETINPDNPLDRWTEPRWWTDHATLRFLYADHREELFPWTSIVHAEYQPPNPQKGETQ